MERSASSCSASSNCAASKLKPSAMLGSWPKVYDAEGNYLGTLQSGIAGESEMQSLELVADSVDFGCCSEWQLITGGVLIPGSALHAQLRREGGRGSNP